MVRPSSIRLTSALLALVWITAPLAAVFHGLAEEHRYCAEHRGFEEGTQATQAGSDRTGAREGAGAASHDTDQHEACSFKAVWRSDQTLRGPGLHVAPAPEPAHVVRVSLEAPRLADVLASAPKTSPPHPAA